MLRTPSLIDAGIKSFMTLQSCTDAASACVFLVPVVHMVLWMTGATQKPMDEDSQVAKDGQLKTCVADAEFKLPCSFTKLFGRSHL